MITRFAIVSGEHAGMRLDTYLAQLFLGSGTGSEGASASTVGGENAIFGEHSNGPGTNQGAIDLSRSAIQRLIVRGQITVNGRKTKAGARVKLSDHIQVQWSPPVDTALEPEGIPLQILHEDEDLVVVNKPPGMVVHPAAGNHRGTLVNAILYHCSNLRGIGGEKRPGIVHRLDKDTSGAIVVAKHEESFRHVALQFKQRRVSKEYVALVWGKVNQQSGVINRPVGRHRTDRKRMSSIRSISRSREAITRWELEDSFCLAPQQGPLSWVTLFRLRPQTGRTHQIRVHLSDQGYPVVGDQIYGGKNRGVPKKWDLGVPGLVDFPRQALHAERLRLMHPRTGNPLEVIAPWFQDMKGLLDGLREQCVRNGR